MTDWPVTLCLETVGEYILFLFLPYNLLFPCIDHVHFNLKNYVNYCKSTNLSSEPFDIYQTLTNIPNCETPEYICFLYSHYLHSGTP